jgi:hypothetical protein
MNVGGKRGRTRLVRPCSVVIAAATVLALAPTNALSGANKPITAPTPTQSRTLVAYTAEGGLFFRYTSLIVSARGQSTVTFNRCVVRFRLDATFWKRLKRALKQTNLHAFAGDYPPPPGAADEITEVITVGHDTVRIADFASIPEKVRQELEPLVKILREIVTVGERRMPPSCRQTMPTISATHRPRGVRTRADTWGGRRPPTDRLYRTP